MIKYSRLLWVSVSLIFAFASCSKDDKENIPAPAISNTEIGSDNSKIGYAGNDIHIEANITAPAKIANIKVSIHPEGVSEWQFDSTYAEGYTGLLNAEFHEHIEIPSKAALGHYHLHITITDQNGKSTKIDDEIEVKEDLTLPLLTGFSVEVEDGGDELHVEGTINAVNKIAKVVLEIHGGNWEKEFEYSDDTMIGKTTYDFHKHVDISTAPAGHYHVHLKIIDQAGKEREFEDHFDKP